MFTQQIQSDWFIYCAISQEKKRLHGLYVCDYFVMGTWNNQWESVRHYKPSGIFFSLLPFVRFRTSAFSTSTPPPPKCTFGIWKSKKWKQNWKQKSKCNFIAVVVLARLMCCWCLFLGSPELSPVSKPLPPLIFLYWRYWVWQWLGMSYHLCNIGSIICFTYCKQSKLEVGEGLGMKLRK